MQQPSTLNPVPDNKPLDWFKPDARELARHDDPDEVRRLGEDMLANGQLSPVLAIVDGRMIAGHGRWLGAKAVGIKMLSTNVYPVSITDTQLRLIRASENLQRKDLTGYQKWLLCADLMCGNASWQMKDLAAALHLDPSMVTRLLSPSRCSPAWQEALQAGKVGISDCYCASKLESPKEQDGLLALKLSGASRDDIEQAGRKSRKVSTAETIKLARVRIPLSTGTTLVVSGAEMDLEGLIEALSSALEAARRASKDRLDLRTAERVWRDRAKAS